MHSRKSAPQVPSNQDQRVGPVLRVHLVTHLTLQDARDVLLELSIRMSIQTQLRHVVIVQQDLSAVRDLHSVRNVALGLIKTPLALIRVLAVPVELSVIE